MEAPKFNKRQTWDYQIGIELGDISRYTDVAILRPPEPVVETDMQQVILQLDKQGLIPVLVGSHDIEDIFPTDHIREVGGELYADTDIIKKILEALGSHITNEQRESIKERERYIPSFTGGNCLYLPDTKVMIFNQEKIFDINSDHDNQNDFTLEWNRDIIATRLKLKRNGWKQIPIDTRDTRLPGWYEEENDLDFLLSLFYGDDEQTHAIVADCFAETFLNQLQSSRNKPPIVTHIIPDNEAVKGGCNIADLRNGRLLMPPSTNDAPTTYEILTQHAHRDINIIPMPDNYIGGGGGPRCSTSSFSLI